MKARRALVGCSGNRFKVISDFEIPETLKPNLILCKVAAVALNPVDFKISDYSAVDGAIAGFDFAGEVTRVGECVTRFQLGDRVFGISHGQNPMDKSTGAFSEYALVIDDMCSLIPDNMSFEQASTLGVATVTAGCSISSYLGLPLPDSPAPATESCFVLVAGGATATGVLATQFIKLAGLQPIVTCSPHNSDRMKQLGAVEAFDYHASSCGTNINRFTKGSLSYALDCISSAETMTMCYEAIGSGGGKYVALEPVSTQIKYTRRDVLADWIMALTVFGEPVKLGGVYGRPSMPEHRRLASRLFMMVESLLNQGVLKSTDYEVAQGGLEAIPEGIEKMKKGMGNGRKVVYSLA